MKILISLKNVFFAPYQSRCVPLLVIALAIWASPVYSRAKAGGITDSLAVLAGDTLRLDGRLYRLRSIDVPETNQICRLASGKQYACGEVARTALMDLVVATKVTCKPTGRMVRGVAEATCSAGGFDLSRNMVHTGWALAWPRANNPLLTVEAKAKARKHGLWRGTFEFPWEWRARNGKRPAR